MEIENELDDEPPAIIASKQSYNPSDLFKGLINIKDSKSSGLSLKSRNLSFEVDFEIFKTRFWPKVIMQTKLSPLVVWTEICSEIKGRVDSYAHDFGGIPANQYIKWRRKKATGFLTVEEKV